MEKYYNTVTMDAQVREIFLKELLRNRIDEVVKRYLNLISSNIAGSKITESKEWKNWKNKCHDIRNDVMHQHHKPEPSQVQDALSSAKALLELLKDFLYDENDWLLEGTAFINDRKKAKSYFEKSNAVKPNADAYYYLGNIEYEDQQYDDARKYFQEALKIVEHAFFYYNIGNCDVAQQRHEDASKNYDFAINLNFELRDPYNNPYYQKYRVLTEQNLEYKPDDIITLLKALLNAFPHNTYLLILRAKYALKLDQKVLALDDLETAVNHNGNIRSDIAKDRDFDILKDEDRFKRIMNE
ncbi:MAG: tetratricopeptide repeat protein [Nitrososphaeraceae archaeon]